MQVSANGPDPNSCDECRASAPRTDSLVKPTIRAVSKNGTRSQSEPTTGGQSRKQAKTRKWCCPSCNGLVSGPAKKCSHCGESLAEPVRSSGVSGGSGGKTTLWICLGVFGLLCLAYFLVPTPKKEDRNEFSEVKTTNTLASEAEHQAGDIQNDPINVICAYLEEDDHKTKRLTNNL